MEFERYIPNNLLDYFTTLLLEIKDGRYHCIVYSNEKETKLAIGDFPSTNGYVKAVFNWNEFDATIDFDINKQMILNKAKEIELIYKSSIEIAKLNFPTSILQKVNEIISKESIPLTSERGDLVLSCLDGNLQLEKINNGNSLILMNNVPTYLLKNEETARQIVFYILSDIYQYADCRWGIDIYRINDTVMDNEKKL